MKPIQCSFPSSIYSSEYLILHIHFERLKSLMSLLGLGFRRPECLAEEAGYKVQVLGFHRGLQYCIESMCARNSESLNYELGLFLSNDDGFGMQD